MNKDSNRERELDRLDIEIFAKQTIQSESKLAQIDIEILITFMNSFLEDLGKVYIEEKSIELRRLFIGSIFPGKMIFKNGKLEPLELASAYQVLKAMAASNNSLSADERHYFEPFLAQLIKYKIQ